MLCPSVTVRGWVPALHRCWPDHPRSYLGSASLWPRPRAGRRSTAGLHPGQAQKFCPVYSGTAGRALRRAQSCGCAGSRFLLLTAHGGLQISEALARRWDDLQAKARRLLVTSGKGLKSRVVALSTSLFLAAQVPAYRSWPETLYNTFSGTRPAVQTPCGANCPSGGALSISAETMKAAPR